MKNKLNWLIVEDALKDRKGHWSEYVSTFVRGLTALGDEVVVLCDRKAGGGIMHYRYPEKLTAAFQSYDPAKNLPASFWMRRIRS